MLLLWQHVHTMPIGKLVAVIEQNSSKIVVLSAIVDMNNLCHDAAVMVDNDMGRFSHGFRAIEFDKIKGDEDGNGKEGVQEKPSPGGFDVKVWEMMEESLVSVPANVDAQTEDVIMSLVEGGKLTSPVMKEFGRNLKENRNVSVAVKGDEDGETKGEDGGAGSSEEADGDTKQVEEGKEEDTQDAEVKDVKLGRVLSKANEGKIRNAYENCVEANKMEMPRGAKALIREASSDLGSVLSSLGGGGGDDEEGKSVSVKEAISIVLTKTTEEERERTLTALSAMKRIEQRTKQTSKYRSISGARVG
jgi:hypothetical protein